MRTVHHQNYGINIVFGPPGVDEAVVLCLDHDVQAIVFAIDRDLGVAGAACGGASGCGPQGRQRARPAGAPVGAAHRGASGCGPRGR